MKTNSLNLFCLIFSSLLLVPKCSTIRKLFREGLPTPRHLPSNHKTARKPGSLITTVYIDSIHFLVLDKDNKVLKVKDNTPLNVEVRLKEQRLNRLMQDFDREQAQTKKPLTAIQKEKLFKALCTKHHAYFEEFELLQSSLPASLEYLMVYECPSKTAKGYWVVGATARQSMSSKRKVHPFSFQPR